MKTIKNLTFIALATSPMWAFVLIMLYGYNDYFNLILIPLGIMLIRSMYESYKQV